MAPNDAPDPPGAEPATAPVPAVRPFTVAGRLILLHTLALCAFVGLVTLGRRYVPAPEWLIDLIALGLTLPPLAWSVIRSLRPLKITLRALSDGIRCFRDGDFSVRIPGARRDDLGEIARLFNRMGETLQAERGQIRQRELLLQTALDLSPVAMVLVNPLDRVIYANQEARRMFLGGGALVGRRFGEILHGCPGEMRKVVESGQDGLFSVEAGDHSETYHLACRAFQLNRQRHALYLVRRMTSELARQEAEIWKKVIRVICHELNNSLAPVSSLAHSGSVIARKPDEAHRLVEIHDAIRERIEHLTRFLEGYAAFARLPRPNKERVEWEPWLGGPRRLYHFDLVAEPPTSPGYFDPAQIQQALINLIKNASEASAGEPEITMRIDRLQDGSVRFEVADRGRGMSDEVMRKALLPFYSTKPSGSGLGLPICREIVEAHGGSVRIQSREGGGTVVSFWLPPER